MLDVVWRRLSKDSTERYLKSEVSKILKEYNIKTSTLASLEPYIKTKADFFLRDKYRGGMGSIGRLLNPSEIMEAALGVIANASIMREINKGLIETKTYILKGKDDLKNIQILKPKDVKQPYEQLANGESYKAGGAGDYSHYDPTKPYNPTKQEQPSELSDTLFGRNSLKAGNFNAKEQVKSLQSSPNFELANINYLEQEKDDLQMRLENFYNGQFRKIGEAMALLARCVLVSFSEKKDKNKISRWLKKVINGRKYYLSDQDIANTTNLIRSLADKEYNYYLKSFENQMFIFETKNSLSRYNFGEDKGEVVKKKSYQVDSFKDNSEEKNKPQSVILQTEDEKILSYIKNPNQLLEQKAQAEAKLKNANALEKQIYECLLVYDELKDSVQGLSKYQKAVEKRFFSPIKTASNKQLAIFYIKNNYESEAKYLDKVGVQNSWRWSVKDGEMVIIAYRDFETFDEVKIDLEKKLSTPASDRCKSALRDGFNKLYNPYNLNAQESSLIPQAPSYEPFFKMQEFASLGYEDIDSYFEYLKETNLVYYAQIEADECQELYNYATDEETIKLYQELEKQGLIKAQS